MPIYMISYRSDYVLAYAFYDCEDAYAKLEEVISKELDHMNSKGHNYTRDLVSKNYQVIEVQPCEDIYEYGRDLVIAEIEKEIC